MTDSVCPDFPKLEYEHRWRKARGLMRQKGLDALLVTDHVNFAYLTGHQSILYGSRSRPMCLILPLEAEPVCVLNDIEKENQEKTSWVRNGRYYGIDSTTHTFNPASTLRAVFKELNLQKAAVGAELGFEQRLGLPYNDFSDLQKKLPQTKFVDASDELWKLRMVKSRAEIKRIEKVCEITSNALDETFEAIREGMTEKQVQKILYMKMLQSGADRPESIMFAGCTPPSAIQLKKGKSLILDVSAMYDGYVSDITRTGFIGNPNEEHKKDFELAKQATEKCISIIKPGLRAREIHEACPIKYPKGSRIGHGVGREGTEPPSISGYDETVLEPGMVLSIEPAVESVHGTFKIEEVVVLTRDGCRTLSTAKRKLWTI